MLNKRRSKRQRTQHDINDKFAVVFVEASEVRGMKQNYSNYGEEPDYQRSILNSRHNNDNNEVLVTRTARMRMVSMLVEMKR